MVDFRYHLVSLVSVFLALAIGVILGAGPLQNSIAHGLTGQVDSLRESRDKMRVELDQRGAQLDAASTALLGAGEQLNAGTLTNRRVAIVAAAGADGAIVEKTRQSLTAAGARITGEITLAPAFTDTEYATYRSTLSGNLGSYVKDLPAGGSADAILGAAVDTVVRSAPEDAGATTLITLLTSPENKLIDVAVAPSEAAEVVVFITADPAETAPVPADKATTSPHITDTYQAAFAAIAGRGPAVAVGAGTDGNSVLGAVRSAKNGSTVDSAQTALGDVNIPMAAAAELHERHVHLGVAPGADSAIGERQNSAAPAQAAPAPHPEQAPAPAPAPAESGQAPEGGQAPAGQ